MIMFVFSTKVIWRKSMANDATFEVKELHTTTLMTASTQATTPWKQQISTDTETNLWT